MGAPRSPDVTALPRSGDFEFIGGEAVRGGPGLSRRACREGPGSSRRPWDNCSEGGPGDKDLGTGRDREPKDRGAGSGSRRGRRFPASSQQTSPRPRRPVCARPLEGAPERRVDASCPAHGPPRLPRPSGPKPKSRRGPRDPARPPPPSFLPLGPSLALLQPRGAPCCSPDTTDTPRPGASAQAAPAGWPVLSLRWGLLLLTLSPLAGSTALRPVTGASQTH